MNAPYGITIFCDDIRNEERGKKAYLGVYTGEMLVESDFPIVLPTFALAITFLEPIDDPIVPITMKVFLPNSEGDSEPLVEFDLPLDRPERPESDSSDSDAEFRAAIIPIKAGPLVIQAAGYIKVRAYRGDEEIRLGSLRVRKAESD